MKTQEYLQHAFWMNRLYVKFSRIYFIAPFLLMPISSYLANNWWFLLGIPIFFSGVFFNYYVWISLAAASFFIFISQGYDFGVIFFLFWCVLIGKYLFNVPQKYKKQEEYYKQMAASSFEDK